MFAVPIILTALFFVVLLAIAVWGMKQTVNTDDFFLGGKTLGPWFLAFSYGTAYFSAVIFVGFAGKFGWQFGINALWVGVANAVIGAGLAWIVLGKRTRTMTRNLGAQTMPEFFSARFETNGMKVLAALIIFVFLTPYSASVFMGLSYFFEIVFGKKADFTVILTVLAAVAFFYITFGGYKAVARIDFVQGIVMLAGSVMMVYVIAKYFTNALNTGYAEFPFAVQDAYQKHLEAEKVSVPPWYILPSVCFMTSFGVWGMPQMIHKYYAIRDEKEIWRGAIISTVFAMIIGCAAYFTGAMSHLIELDPAAHIPYIEKNGIETVNYDHLVPDLLASRLNQVLLSVILLLVLSASFSTLSSLVLVSASAITIDLYKGYVNPQVAVKRELLLMRILCGVFIFLSWFIALFRPAWIVSLMSVSWGAVAGSFLAAYIYGLFWKRTTKLGAYSGIWTGLLLSNGTYWYLVYTKGGAVAGMNSTLIASAAMIIPFAVVPLVSLITKQVKPETLEKAFKN